MNEESTDAMVHGGTLVIDAETWKDLHRWTAAAEAGDGAAAYRLGNLFREGIRLPCRPRVAFRWYVRGALAGDAEAMNNLGACYHNAFACERDMGNAIHWYTRAAEAGSVIALDNLGCCYLEGDGVPEDPERAASYFRLAHAQGDARAAGRLAEMGLGIEE